MKKYIITLLLLISVYFGYSYGISSPESGDSASSSVASHLENAIIPAKSSLTHLLGKDSTNSAAPDDAETLPADQEEGPDNKPLPEESFTEKVSDITDFKEKLETRIQRETFTPLKKINPMLVQALVDTEDKRFYEHGALDLVGVARAAVANYVAGRTVQGGSTLSQQTVKNIFLSNHRTFSRKIQELLLAIQLERKYSKDEILELYLNTIYFGHGAYGVANASEVYFGKTPEQLNLAQCAMLAGLPQAPSAYDPLNHPQAGMKRMQTVLALMVEAGGIQPEQAQAAPAHLWDKGRLRIPGNPREK